jgi:hypothetical protein
MPSHGNGRTPGLQIAVLPLAVLVLTCAAGIGRDRAFPNENRPSATLGRGRTAPVSAYAAGAWSAMASFAGSQ